MTLVRPLMSYTNFASTHAARAYVEFQQYVVADADRERRDLLEHLLAGELPASSPLLAAARAYGIGRDTPLVLAVAVPAAGALDADAPQAASAAIARVGLGPAKTLVVARQVEIIAVAPIAPGADALEVCERLEAVHRRLDADGVPLAMGISTVADSVAELPRAYVEARTALDCVADGGVAALPRLSPFEYLARGADETARRMVDVRVRAFLEEDRARGGVLVATVRAFVAADLNLRAAAECLQVHPNTVQYRIGRVGERTGRNLRRIDDLIDVLVAIALDDATGSPWRTDQAPAVNFGASA
jgi:sugar diacid utilization regulator